MSSEENAVLSQADIDAMMGSAPSGVGETPPATEQASPAEPQAAQPTAVPAAAESVAAAAASRPNDTALADVAQRLARLEAAVGRISQGGSASGQADANIQALAQHLQALSSRVDEILQHLPNTLGYGARATFQCGSCNTQGWVASRVFCTHCGTDTAMGWWPQA